MASGTFEKNNVDWWMQQQQQRLGEWMEGLWAGVPTPDLGVDQWTLPDWFLQGFFWLVILGLIAGAVSLLYKIFRPYLETYWQAGLFRSPFPITAPEPTPTEWLSRSRLAQQQGNYREACRALYMATIQGLNDRQLIRQEDSRTDGEYLSLLLTLDRPQPYQLLIRTHERLCFSDAIISAENFERCWQAYQETQRP